MPISVRLRPWTATGVALLVSGCWPNFDALRGGPGDAASAGADAGAMGAMDATTADAALQPSASYSAAVLTDAPIAYWRLDDASGSVIAKDRTGQHDATCFGSPTFQVAGARGGGDHAARFDGASARLDAGDAFDFAGAAPFTLEAWISPRVLGGGYHRILSKENLDAIATRTGTLLSLTTNSSGDPSGVSFERWVSGTTVSFASTARVPPADAWTYLAVTFDGANTVLFFDGEVVDRSQPLGAATATPGHSFTWGGPSRPYIDTFFDGALDELAIYDHALAEDRIRAHFNAAGN